MLFLLFFFFSHWSSLSVCCDISLLLYYFTHDHILQSISTLYAAEWKRLKFSVLAFWFASFLFHILLFVDEYQKLPGITIIAQFQHSDYCWFILCSMLAQWLLFESYVVYLKLFHTAVWNSKFGNCGCHMLGVFEIRRTKCKEKNVLLTTVCESLRQLVCKR